MLISLVEDHYSAHFWMYLNLGLGVVHHHLIGPVKQEMLLVDQLVLNSGFLIPVADHSKTQVQLEQMLTYSRSESNSEPWLILTSSVYRLELPLWW